MNRLRNLKNFCSCRKLSEIRSSDTHLKKRKTKLSTLVGADQSIFLPFSLVGSIFAFPPLGLVLLKESVCLLLIWGACSRGLIKNFSWISLKPNSQEDCLKPFFWAEWKGDFKNYKICKGWIWVMELSPGTGIMLFRSWPLWLVSSTKMLLITASHRDSFSLKVCKDDESLFIFYARKST